MPERLHRQNRKEKLHQWRAQQRAAARKTLPLRDEQMQSIFDMLNLSLPTRGCDRTLRLVREWAEQNDVKYDSLVTWFRENGGHCDCEVLSNCEQRWRDANHDVNW